jgi:hypothetical protein
MKSKSYSFSGVINNKKYGMDGTADCEQVRHTAAYDKNQ